MVSFYNYSDSEFLPIFHERKFNKKEFQDIANQIQEKIKDNEHNKWVWDYPNTFLKYAKEYGFKDIDILEVDTLSFKVTRYGDIE